MPRIPEEKVDIVDNPDVGSVKDEKEEDSLIPKFTSSIALTEEQKERFSADILEELNAIKKERMDEGIDDKIELLNQQYEGLIDEDEDQQFSVTRGLTKDKVDKIVNRLANAHLEPDPIFAVSPRPDYSLGNGQEVAEKQEDFLDNKLDEQITNYREVTEQTYHSAVLHGNGIKKFEYRLEVQKRKREEVYQGKPKYYLTTKNGGKALVQDEDLSKLINTDLILEDMDMIANEFLNNGSIILNSNDGNLIEYRNDGLKDFLQSYPSIVIDDEQIDIDSQNAKYIRALHKGRKINIVASYNETVYNDPFPKNVDLRNFYVRLGTEGNIGMSQTKLIVERIPYTWWELERLKKKPEYYADEIDRLKYDDEDSEANSQENSCYKSNVYNILECTYLTKLEEDDEDEVKLKVWMDEERNIIVGCQYYPYYQIPVEYVDYHMPKKRSGFYQPGLGEYLTDDSITVDAITNFMLEALWTANMITPITEPNSVTEEQFINRRFSHGVPLRSKSPKNLRFVNEFIKPPDVGGLLNAMQWVNQGADNKTGTNAGISGRSDPIDPTAPARKTLALLAESNINIKSYILAMAPSMNADAYILLSMYHQMSNEGRKYKARPDRVVDGNPFKVITRSELIARTNIQSMSYTFATDKLNEKRENLALMQILRTEPLVTRYPTAVYNLLRSVVMRWSPFWKHNIDKILPTDEQYNQSLMETTFMALTQYIQSTVERSKITGEQPQFNLEELMPMVAQAQKFMATPPTKEEAKVIEEQNK